jgi:hypothetical protein
MYNLIKITEEEVKQYYQQDGLNFIRRHMFDILNSNNVSLDFVLNNYWELYMTNTQNYSYMISMMKEYLKNGKDKQKINFFQEKIKEFQKIKMERDKYNRMYY